MRRAFAEHLAVGREHANPVEREALVAWRVAEAELVVVLDGRRLEDLHYLPEGLRSASIGLETHDAVVEEKDGIFLRMIGRLHRELVDGVRLHGGITLLGDFRRLRGERGSKSEQEKRGAAEHRDLSER